MNSIRHDDTSLKWAADGELSLLTSSGFWRG